jgi:hypothetical protein
MRIRWDIEEVVAMISIYFRYQSGEIQDLKAELTKLSHALNHRADILGISHDETFRNMNGMNMIFQNVTYVDTDGQEGMSGVSSMIYYVYYMYKVDRSRFDEILNDFIKEYM